MSKSSRLQSLLMLVIIGAGSVRGSVKLKKDGLQHLSKQSRSLNLVRLINPFQLFNKKQLSRRVGKCDEKGGTLVNGECYQFFLNDDNGFEAARSFCRNRGGDMWTPDFTDPLLLPKLFKFMPQISSASEGTLWVGATVQNGRIIDLNGNDITDTFSVLISSDDTITNGNCLILNFQNFQYKLEDVNCNANQEFICEYPIKKKPKLAIHKNIFQW